MAPLFLWPHPSQRGLCTSCHMTSHTTSSVCFSPCYLQTPEAAFLKMKEKYLSVSIYAVKESHWEVVRNIVMFGKGEWALLTSALRPG